MEEDDDRETENDNLQTGATGQTSIIAVPMVCYLPIRLKSSPAKSIEGSDDATKYYTGLESWKLFEHILSFMNSASPVRVIKATKMLPVDCLLLVLMRLRLNLPLENLSIWYLYVKSN